MGDDKSKLSVVDSIVNSKAAEKLAGTIQDVVDYTVGPNRIVKIATARGQAEIIKAQAEIEINALHQQAAARLLDKEVRHQRNINAIADEAFKALPPPEAQENISDAPVSEDFVYRFFDECQSIGNEEMQKIWGKLLAGEVMRPGSFHPRTLGILKDMQPDDATLFAKLCNFGWVIGNFSPLIFDNTDAIYTNNEMTFPNLSHLEALGLIQFHTVGGLVKNSCPKLMTVMYHKKLISIVMAENSTQLPIGLVQLTGAGLELAKLCETKEIPGLLEYVTKKWEDGGHQVYSSMIIS